LSVHGSKDLLPVLISLGSNINPRTNLLAAAKLLSDKVDNLIFSSVWKSPAVGSEGPDYLNSAVLINTDLPLQAIKADIISPIENQLGRIRSVDKYMDRTIDLDILIYGNLLIDPELWTLAHLAIPASELLPNFMNKETKETLQETAGRLLKISGVSRYLTSRDISASLEL
jgi:2-amino-4-hydroxy-6-hydroxymethyldihydropteridine diphosphokinase